MKNLLLNKLIREYGFEAEQTLHFAKAMDKTKGYKNIKKLYAESIAIGD